MDATLRVLNRLVDEGVVARYAIGGGMAAMFYAEPVLTYDLDIFVLLPSDATNALISLTPLYERLGRDGYRAEKEFVNIEGVPVQFLVAYNPLVEEAVERAVEMPYGSTLTHVVSLEHLLAIMLQTGRPKDRERLTSMLDQAVPDQEALNAILDRHGLRERWSRWMKRYESD
jgi:hypothetical protein